MRDDVFQFDELVDPYRVALSNDLEENLNFQVIENTLVNVDVEEFNDILRTSRHTQVNKDDDNDGINVEDSDGVDKIEEEEEDNSDICITRMCNTIYYNVMTITLIYY